MDFLKLAAESFATMKLLWKYGLLMALAAFATALSAQRPTGSIPTSGPTLGGPAQANNQQKEDEVPDTVGLHVFYADRPELERPYSDSLFDNYFHQYDPARQRKIDLLSTGNLGGATRHAAYEPVFRRALDIGFHQYDIYHIPAAAAPFYRLQKAYTNLAYYLQGEQADSYLTAQFARNFAKGTHFSIDYKRLSQIGNQNQYPQQHSRQTALTAGLWTHSAKGRYNGFFVFASNTSEQEDNGGLLQEPQSIDGRPLSPANSTIFLNDAQTRYSFRELSYTQHWRIGGGTDSTGLTRRTFPFMHRINWFDGQYKFFDREPASGTEFYARFPNLLTDERGLRYFVRHRKLENTVQLATSRKGRQGGSDLLEVALIHTLNLVHLEPLDTVVNNLFLSGRMVVNPRPVLRFEAQAHLGLLGNAGDYRVQAGLTLDLPKTGSLYVQFLNQLYSPTLVQHRFFISQREVWNNAFAKTLETGLSATLRVKPLRTEVSGAYYLINNLVYFDTLAMPRQTGVPVSVLQLTLHQNLSLWKFHLDNTVVFQTASEPVIRLPQIFSKHSLYYEGLWFKKVMLLRTGFDLRYNTAWMADYYNPVVGQFHLQQRQEAAFYPAVDWFLSIRRGDLRAYVKWEGLEKLLLDDRYYYQSAFYALRFPGVRIGLKWLLVD